MVKITKRVPAEYRLDFGRDYDSDLRMRDYANWAWYSMVEFADVVNLYWAALEPTPYERVLSQNYIWKRYFFLRRNRKEDSIMCINSQTHIVPVKYVEFSTDYTHVPVGWGKRVLAALRLGVTRVEVGQARQGPYTFDTVALFTQNNVLVSNKALLQEAHRV